MSLDGWLHQRPARLRRLLAATAITTTVSALAVLPVLPPSDVAWTSKVGPISGATIGWPQLVHTVRTVWLSLPPRQRASAVIFTADYSEAGAINELGTGLPTAVSAHNTDWWWGPGNPHATTVLAVAPGKAAGGYSAYLHRFFTSVRTVATVSNPYGVHNSDWGGHVYLCTGPRQPWGQMVATATPLRLRTLATRR